MRNHSNVKIKQRVLSKISIKNTIDVDFIDGVSKKVKTGWSYYDQR